jgi:hypothetical protein
MASRNLIQAAFGTFSYSGRLGVTFGTAVITNTVLIINRCSPGNGGTEPFVS